MTHDIIHDMDKADQEELNQCREKIDTIDRQLLSLLSMRQELAATIGQIKRGYSIEVFDPAREEKVLRKLISNSRGSLTEEIIRNIYNEIVSAARSVQEPLSVAYFGPEASFTHQAAVSIFGHSASLRAAETIEEVFSLVEKGMCQQGVVPIENSYEGSVNSTLDQLYKYELKIVAEVYLRIRHHLLSRADNIHNIKCLYSHPMAISQCRSWIRANLPRIPVKEVGSTSLAVKAALDNPEAAAVGGLFSALTYGLKLLEEDIEDHPDNVTRFLAIGKKSTDHTGKDKTSILFFLHHKPGALYRALEVLANRNANMTRIESRPMKIRNWQYLFYVDMEGHEQDHNIGGAIKEMEETCLFVKRLGSYPAAEFKWD